MPNNDVTLYAPPAFIAASAEARELISNGCGTGGWKGLLVPDTLWGLTVTPACNIHDWMYVAGETHADKEEADRVFLNNLLRIVNAAGGFGLIKWLRRRRAHTYYEAVRIFGGPAFWDGKNESSNEITYTRKIWA